MRQIFKTCKGECFEQTWCYRHGPIQERSNKFLRDYQNAKELWNWNNKKQLTVSIIKEELIRFTNKSIQTMTNVMQYANASKQVLFVKRKYWNNAARCCCCCKESFFWISVENGIWNDCKCTNFRSFSKKFKWVLRIIQIICKYKTSVQNMVITRMKIKKDWSNGRKCCE